MVQPVTEAEFLKWNTADRDDIEPILDIVIEQHMAKLFDLPHELSVDEAEDLEHLKMLLSAFNPEGGYYYRGYVFLLRPDGEVLMIRRS